MLNPLRLLLKPAKDGGVQKHYQAFEKAPPDEGRGRG